tara:strand:+ start:3891 stop:4832 length:942 start_codon:yes stop_codon:yes gene_type:complete
MTYSLTIFKNQYDNKTHRKLNFDTWDQFSNFLYKLSKRPLGGKKDAELISPAVYEINTTRANKNVLAWESWCAVDVDDIEVEGSIEDYVRTRFRDWNFICYSTASSTNMAPKFRLVFPLVQRIEASRIKHFWFALNTEMEKIGDRQTKDLSRMYFIPASYSNAFNFIFSNTNGADIDPNDLMEKHAYSDKESSKDFLDRLPDAWKDQIIEYRKTKLDNTNFVWTDYRDCPFWPKSMAAEYLTISGTGWYRQMYRIMIAVAGKAVEKGYPITANQIVDLCRQFDNDTGKWYENRPMEVEANNALEYAYRNGVIQ